MAPRPGAPGASLSRSSTHHPDARLIALGTAGETDMLRTAFVAVLLTCGPVIPAAAADKLDAATAVTSTPAAESALLSDVDWSLPAVHFGAVERSRGPLLPALYVGLSGLNTFDVVTTSKAL